jgi:hypothetical protein
MSVERFMIKSASFGSVFPSVAGPAVGGYMGYGLGKRYLNNGHLGALLGTLTAGTAGKLIGEKVEEAEEAHAGEMPPGAPYALDPTAEDIPPWALQGARMLQPALKQAGHFGDLVGGDLGGIAWPIAEGVREKQPAGQIARNVAGQSLGTLGGGLVGHAAGGLIDKLVGHPVTGPLGVPLSTLLAGLGATIGNFKGLELARR